MEDWYRVHKDQIHTALVQVFPTIILMKENNNGHTHQKEELILIHSLLTIIHHQKYGGLPNILAKVYPEYPWDWANSPKTSHDTPSKFQLYLYKAVKQLFPDEEVLLNYQHPDLIYKESGRVMELDIFIMGLNIAFEAQGILYYHYRSYSLLVILILIIRIALESNY